MRDRNGKARLLLALLLFVEPLVPPLECSQLGLAQFDIRPAFCLGPLDPIESCFHQSLLLIPQVRLTIATVLVKLLFRAVLVRRGVIVLAAAAATAVVPPAVAFPLVVKITRPTARCAPIAQVYTGEMKRVAADPGVAAR